MGKGQEKEVIPVFVAQDGNMQYILPLEYPDDQIVSVTKIFMDGDPYLQGSS